MSKDQQDRLSFAILQHFDDLISSKAVDGEAAESMAVAAQCLTEALGVDVKDPEHASRLKVDQTLQDVFDGVFPPRPTKKAATKDEEAKANDLKDEGNDLMKQNKYEEAIEKYSEAIEVVPVATYFCNRAAAYSKLAQHESAVKDAEDALVLDAGYSKAYARMGFAYLNMNQLPEAEDAYSNALRLDSGNQSYKDNLDAVKEKISAGPNVMAQAPMGGMPAMPGMPGMPGMPNLAGMDFSQILNNPAFMNMAQQFMTDPNMQQAFTSMADQFMQGGGVGGGETLGPNGVPENIDINAMLGNPALRSMAENFEAQNPQMMDQLRNQFRRPEDDTEPPPNP